MYAWGHNRVAQLGIGNSFTVPRNVEGAYFLPNPQLVESLLGMVSEHLPVKKYYKPNYSMSQGVASWWGKQR